MIAPGPAESTLQHLLGSKASVKSGDRFHDEGDRERKQDGPGFKYGEL
jgi:hypothetical protein